ncbi:hypothetical protein ACSBR2_015894 [Camellia fascicularis]
MLTKLCLSEKRRVTIQDFRGKTLVSMREYYRRDGKDLPTAKGQIFCLIRRTSCWYSFCSSLWFWQRSTLLISKYTSLELDSAHLAPSGYLKLPNVVWITGASRGIEWEVLAKQLASLGAKLIISA